MYVCTMNWDSEMVQRSILYHIRHYRIMWPYMSCLTFGVRILAGELLSSSVIHSMPR